MLKSISNLGNVLNKSEQREINGGLLQCPEGTVYFCLGAHPQFSCWCMKLEEDPVDKFALP